MFDGIPDETREFLIRLLLVVLVCVALVLLRRALMWLLTKPLQRLLEPLGLAGSDEAIRSILTRPVRYVLLASALYLSALILNISPSLTAFALHISRTLVIAAFGFAAFRLIGVLVQSRQQFYNLTKVSVDEALLPFLRVSSQIIVVVMAVLITMQEWGFDVTGLIAGLGIGALAVSLGAQETLSNLFGFAAVVSDRPFVVGETIRLPDVEGNVEKLGMRSTLIRKYDQALVSVPNSVVAHSAILNWSRLSKRRVDFTLGVTYKTGAEQMEELIRRLRELLAAQERVDPTTVDVYFVSFGASSLNILIRCYLNLADWAEFTAAQERLLLDVMRVVESLNLEIAFPTQSIYFEQKNDDALPQPDTQQATPLSPQDE